MELRHTGRAYADITAQVMLAPLRLHVSADVSNSKNMGPSTFGAMVSDVVPSVVPARSSISRSFTAAVGVKSNS